MKKISVIMPIYNSEKTISKAIDSVLNQSYENIELILVDDGSNDSSPKICDEYAKKYNNVKVFHKENGGTADARNYGIIHSTGDYIGFIDNDDFIHRDMYDILLKACEENNCSIAQVAYRIVSNEYIDINKKINKYDCKIYNSSESFINDYVYDIETYTDCVWTKIYKREIFNNIKFKKGFYFEDTYIKPFVMLACDKFVDIDLDMYYYFYYGNDNSKIHIQTPRSKKSLIEQNIDILCNVSDLGVKNNMSLCNKLISKNLFTSLHRFSKIVYKDFYKNDIEKSRNTILECYNSKENLFNNMSKLLYLLFKKKNYLLLFILCVILRSVNYGKYKNKCNSSCI